MSFEPKKLNIGGDLEGLTLKMLKEHFKLYEGYVKKTNEIQEKLISADKSQVSAVYSHLGELKRQETFAVNGMKLHELYFGHLGNGNEPNSNLLQMITEDFGSFEKWKEDIAAVSMVARGWAILAFDLNDNRLHNYAGDAHNVGAVWGAIPLIALDVYEHAYFMDYGIDRKSYLDAFFKNLNWDFAGKIAEEFNLLKRRQKAA